MSIPNRTIGEEQEKGQTQPPPKMTDDGADEIGGTQSGKGEIKPEPKGN